MFKNITALRINTPESKRLLNSSLLKEAVETFVSEPPAVTLWSRLGFGHPECFGDSPLFEGAMGVKLFTVRLQERLLPGKVISQHVNAKKAELEEKEDRKLNRKEIAQIKESVVIEMLPKAFVKATDTLVMVFRDWLIIDTGSAKVCDEITCFLRDCLADMDEDKDFEMLSLRPLSAGIDVNEWMAGVIVNDNVAHFKALDSAVMKGRGKEGGTLRFKDIDLTDDEVQNAIISGKRVVEMSMAWAKNPLESGDDMHFSMNEHLVIKRVKFADLLIKQAESDAGDDASAVAHFDATMAILSDMIVSLVTQLETTLAKPVVEDDEL